MKKIDKLRIVKSYFPDAQMELNHTTNFQMLVAVMLSAQTTDKMVNRATKELFKKYKEAKDFKDLTFDEVYSHIKIVGFAKTKSQNLIKLANEVYAKYDGEVVNNREKLMELPGVGQKTANVVLANIYDEQFIAVDTHVHRVAKRLQLCKQKDSVLKAEEELIKILKNENMNQYHHSLIFFGRYHCTARNPACINCKLRDECYHYSKIKKREEKKEKNGN